MPFVKIFHGDNFSKEICTRINKIVHLSLEECFHIPEDDTFQLLVSTDLKMNFVDKGYLLKNTERDENFIYIEIFCGPGRTVEQKKSLYKMIAEEIEQKTIVGKQNVFILLNEVPIENWSFGDGKAQMLH